jgi:hypothetical protein
MSTYNQLDLQTLGSQPIMPKNLPDHRLDYIMMMHMSDNYCQSHASLTTLNVMFSVIWYLMSLW